MTVGSVAIKIHLRDGASVPEYATDGSSGADVRAYLEHEITIRPGETALIPTGISLEIPEGIEAQIRPRSGLAVKHGITLLNTPGTIDSDYRGEIRIIMTNFGTSDFTVTHGMKIAQMVFAPVYKADFQQVEELTETERRDGGFGHTGV